MSSTDDSPTPPAPTRGRVWQGLDRIITRPAPAAGILFAVYFVAVGFSVLGADFVFAVPFLIIAVLAGGLLCWLVGRLVAPDRQRSTAWRVRNLLGSVVLSLAGTATLIAYAIAGTAPDGNPEPLIWVVSVAATITVAAPIGLVLWLMLLVQAVKAKPSGFLPRIPAEQRTLMFVLCLLAWGAGLLVLGFLTFMSVFALSMFGAGFAESLT